MILSAHLKTFLISFFLFGLGFLSPLLTGLFFVPLYYLFLREDKIFLFLFVLFFAVLLDVGEGFFPLNTLLIPVLFAVFAVQRFLPYEQDRLFFSLGFFLLMLLFFITKTLLLHSFFDVGFSWAIVLNFLSILFVFCVTEIILSFAHIRQEKIIRARR